MTTRENDKSEDQSFKSISSSCYFLFFFSHARQFHHSHLSILRQILISYSQLPIPAIQFLIRVCQSPDHGFGSLHIFHFFVMVYHHLAESILELESNQHKVFFQ